jgi:hypothetical protein
MLGLSEEPVPAVPPGSDADDSLAVQEDAVGRPSVSISDVSSDPLEFRHQPGCFQSRSASRSAAGSDDEDEDENVAAGPAVGDGSDSDGGGDRELSVASSSANSGRRLCAPRAAIEAVDLSGVDTGAAVGTVDAAAISPHAVAVVESVILRSGVVVLRQPPNSAVLLDVGTRLCLADGTVVGTITTLLGPVKDCAYALYCDSTLLALLHMEEKLGEGALLHADTTTQQVLYDPEELFRAEAARKPSDASFVNDEERPATARPDFSDDDEEKMWKRRKKMRLLSSDDTLAGNRGEDEVDDDVSSIESEVELDENGEVVAYKPKEHVARRTVRAADPSAAQSCSAPGRKDGREFRGSGRGQQERRGPDTVRHLQSFHQPVPAAGPMTISVAGVALGPPPARGVAQVNYPPEAQHHEFHHLHQSLPPMDLECAPPALKVIRTETRPTHLAATTGEPWAEHTQVLQHSPHYPPGLYHGFLEQQQFTSRESVVVGVGAPQPQYLPSTIDPQLAGAPTPPLPFKPPWLR